MVTLTCSRCGEDKPDDAFNRNGVFAHRRGRTTKCRVCETAPYFDGMSVVDLERRPSTSATAATCRRGGLRWMNTPVSAAELVRVFYRYGLSIQQCRAALPAETDSTIRSAWILAYDSRLPPLPRPKEA